MTSERKRRVGFSIRATSGICACILAVGVGSIARADDDENSSEINRRLYQQLDPQPDGSPASGKVQTVSGQLYISKQYIDRAVINDALAAMLAEDQGNEASVAVRRPARLNFEINFEKNSAELNNESRRGLDQLGEVLAADYLDTRFILGGHTDLDGNEEINQPLSQARAESARAYLVEQHEIASDRIVAEGFGTSEPLFETERTAEDKLYNRRVDLRPIRNDP